MKMIKKILIFIVLIFEINRSYAFFYNETPIIEVIKSDDFYFKNYYNPFFNQTTSFLKLFSESDEINPSCRKSLNRWINGITENEIWSLKFLEATGKTVAGKLAGGNLNYGFFDYCTGFEKDEGANIDFDGKYCLVSLHTKETEMIKNDELFKYNHASLSDKSKRMIEFAIGNLHGICMPHTCKIEEFTSVFNKLFKSYGFNVIPQERCTTKSEPEPFSKLQILSLIILSTFVVLCILSCFIKNDFLSNFSLVDNFQLIYNLDPNNNTDETKAFLHGFKTVLIFFSIGSHIYSVTPPFYPQPYSTSKEIRLPKYLKIFGNKSFVLADILFFFGGFFAMFSWFDLIKNDKIKYNFKIFFLSRYTKIVIISIVVILISFILPHLGSGPYYSDYSNHLYHNCKNNWWYVFLLISNEQSSLDMCIIPAWYLSADFQIYILNYFILYYLIKKPKLGFTLAFIQCFVISSFSLFYFHYNNFPTNFKIFDFLIYDMIKLRETYFPSYYHYNTYVIGMICAWLIKNKIKPKFLDIKLVKFLISAIALPIHLVFQTYLHYVEESGNQLNFYLNFSLPLLEKLINLIPFFWLFYSGASSYKNPRNTDVLKKTGLFMSGFFVPWSRLSFVLILCQFLYFFYFGGNIRQPIMVDLVSIIKELISAYLLIFIMGNVIFLFFEQPITNLCQKYLGFKQRHQINDEKKVL